MESMTHDRLDRDDVADRYRGLVREQLRLLGEDPERDGLLRTPERVE